MHTSTCNMCAQAFIKYLCARVHTYTCQTGLYTNMFLSELETPKGKKWQASPLTGTGPDDSTGAVIDSYAPNPYLKRWRRVRTGASVRASASPGRNAHPRKPLAPARSGVTSRLATNMRHVTTRRLKARRNLSHPSPRRLPNKTQRGVTAGKRYRVTGPM